MTAYLLLKTLHILGAVLFLGNIITGVFWKLHADRTGDAKLMAHAVRGIIVSDRLFTIPGVVLLTLAGIGAAIVGKIPMLSTTWTLWGIILLIVAGVVFSTQIGPLQQRMLEAARATPFDRARYDALSVRWTVWGIIATLAPLAAAVLMVTKP